MNFFTRVLLWIVYIEIENQKRRERERERLREEGRRRKKKVESTLQEELKTIAKEKRDDDEDKHCNESMENTVIEQDLSPDTQSCIPTTSAKSHAICCDTKTRYSVFVSCKNTDSFTLERVPDIAVVVIIATK